MQMKLWKYKHYKWNEYEVIGLAFTSWNAKSVVVYKQLYDSWKYAFGTLWVRDTEEFLWTVEFEGNILPRFIFIG